MSPSSSPARTPATPLYGDVMTYAPFWCVVNCNERFVSSANPNMLYFNEDGSANVNNEAGVRAFDGDPREPPVPRARARSRRTGSRSTSSWAAGNGVQGGVVPELDEDHSGQPGPRHRERRPVHQDGRHAGPRRRRRADPPTGDLLQHLLRRERVLRPEPGTRPPTCSCSGPAARGCTRT